MSAQKSGRQSPPPEDQPGRQQQEPPSTGPGVDDDKSASNKIESEKTIQGLASNPKGPLDDHAKGIASKTVESTDS